MGSPPPDDLFQWPKQKLVKEVQRLRALVREHSDRPGSDPRASASSSGGIIGGDDPHGEGTVLLDMRSAVLLEAVDVSLVDTKQEQPVAMMLVLSGRVNYSADRVQHVYLFGPDGASGIVSEVTALVSRAQQGQLAHGQAFAEGFMADFRRRDEQMRRDGTL